GPGASERRAMLEEAVDVIRRLLTVTNVNHRGTYYRVENAELFTVPVTPPPIVLAAAGPKSAALAGQIGDGMIAVVPDATVVEAFEAAGGDGKPRLAQLHVCWAPTTEEAERTARRMWPNVAIRGQALSDLARPRDFEEVADQIPPAQAVSSVVCGPDPARHLEAVGR